MGDGRGEGVVVADRPSHQHMLQRRASAGPTAYGMVDSNLFVCFTRALLDAVPCVESI